MKTTELIAVMLFLAPPGCYAQWEILSIDGLDSIPCMPMYDFCEQVEDINFRDIAFLDRRTGFIAGGSIYLHGAWGYLFRTTNSGADWERIYQSNDFCPYSIEYLGQGKALFSCGGAWWDGSRVLRTTNNGINWSVVDTSGGELCFVDLTTGFRYEGEVLYRTDNGGLSWEPVYTTDPSDRNVPINAFFFLNKDLGWLIADDKVVKVTGPDSWQTVYTGTNLLPKKIYFVNEQTGWFSNGFVSGFALFHTVDGGTNWTEMPTPGYLIHDLYFENEQHGWAVGEDNLKQGALLETFDGGNSWNELYSGLPGRLNALHFSDSVGWAVGDKGQILKIAWVDEVRSETDNLLLSFSVHPNPFSSATKIEYRLHRQEPVELSIFDLSGRKVATLAEEIQAPGRHERVWHASGYRPGIYLCVLQTRQHRQIRKLILTE